MYSFNSFTVYGPSVILITPYGKYYGQPLKEHGQVEAFLTF